MAWRARLPAFDESQVRVYAPTNDAGSQSNCVPSLTGYSCLMKRRSARLRTLAAALLFAGVAARPAVAADASTECKAWRLVPFPVVEGGQVTGLAGISSTDVWTVGTIVGP